MVALDEQSKVVWVQELKEAVKSTPKTGLTIYCYLNTIFKKKKKLPFQIKIKTTKVKKI